MTRRPALRGRDDFRRVGDSGGRARRDGIMVAAATRAGSDPGRLGLIVPSTVGGAVVRNRIRRRLRAAFREVRVPDDVDVTIRATGDAGSVDFQLLENNLQKALDQAMTRMPS